MNRLTRFEPGRGIRHEFDWLFDELLPALSADATPGYTPALDVAETDGSYVARVDLPGLRPEDIEVRFDDGVLSVRGEREHRTSEAREGLLRSERSFGQFYRSLRLPRGTDPAGVEADFDNGVLTVTVPKAEASRPRQIEVRASPPLAAGDGSTEPVEATPVDEAR